MATPPSGTASSTELSQLGESASLLNAEQIAFIEGLCVLPAVQPIDDFAADDRLFLAGIGKRLRARELEMLMMPDASLRLSEMLRQGDRPIKQYVDLVSKDASLSVEVLKAANSAFYANAASTSSLQDAIMRVGLARLQSILMVVLLKSRVMKSGPLQARADLLLELAFPVGFVASQIAKARRKPADPCFMKGMLLHVEHLLILGLVTDVAREHRTTQLPSTGAVLQAFSRYGPEIRETVAQRWNLASILLPGPQDGDDTNYPAIRMSVICRWLGRSLPVIDGVPAEMLEAVASQVRLRVAPVVAEAGDAPSGMPVSASDDQWLKAFLASGNGH